MGKMTLFLSGEILSVNARDELCEAMLIEDDRIVFVGDERDAVSLADGDAEICDLKGRAVVAGAINTCPIDLYAEGIDLFALEARAMAQLALGWTAVRMSQSSLAGLRRLVGNGSLTSSTAPACFLLYERAELISERSRLLRLSASDLLSESAERQIEWASADGRPIALAAEGKYEAEAMLGFFSRLASKTVSGARNRIYLTEPLSDKHLPCLCTRRITPVFTCADSDTARSLFSACSHGVGAVFASQSSKNPLSLLSDALTPIGDDYREVPALLSTLTLHAAALESVSDEIGSLEWGKRADFFILSSPLIGCPPSRLCSLRIDECWIKGRRLFSSRSLLPLSC